MRPEKKLPKVRLNLDMPVEVKEKIEALRDTNGIESLSEVVRRALAIYDLVMSAQAEGTAIIFKPKEGPEQHMRFF